MPTAETTLQGVCVSEGSFIIFLVSGLRLFSLKGSIKASLL